MESADRNPPPKHDKKGLGFNAGQQSSVPPINAFTPVKFKSGGIIHQGHANAVEDEGDSDYDLDNWIRPSVPGVELSNWTAQDVIQVMQAQE